MRCVKCSVIKTSRLPSYTQSQRSLIHVAFVSNFKPSYLRLRNMSRNNYIEDPISLPVTKTGKVVNCRKNRTISIVVDYLHLPERMKYFRLDCRLDFFTHFMDSLGDYAEVVDGIDDGQSGTYVGFEEVFYTTCTCCLLQE